MQNLRHRDEIIVLCDMTHIFKVLHLIVVHIGFVSNFVYVFHKHLSKLAFYQRNWIILFTVLFSVIVKVSICSSNYYVFKSGMSTVQNYNSKCIWVSSGQNWKWLNLEEEGMTRSAWQERAASPWWGRSLGSPPGLLSNRGARHQRPHASYQPERWLS